MQLPSPHGRRAFLAGLTGLGMTLLLPNAWARGRVTAEPIRLAGRLGMLAQRMGKAYCQIGLGVAVEASVKILTASRSAFGEHLAALPSQAAEDLARLKEIWSRYEPLLQIPPAKPQVDEVVTLADEMSALAHKITTQLQLDTPPRRALALSTRLGTLSQSMSLLYMRRQWGIAPTTAEQEADAARTEMAAGLRALARSRATTHEIAGEIKLARLRWLLLDQALNQQDFAGNNGLGACRTLGSDCEKRPQQAQFLPDSPPHSRTMGQEVGEKWAAAVTSPPEIPKSDRLLAYAREVADESEALLAVLDRIAFLHVGQARRASSAS